MFLLAAAGSINKALIINIPTHFIDNITINAIKTAKHVSITLILIPLLLANDSLMLIECNLLNNKHQNTNVVIKIINKYIISFGVILNISPTSKLEYCEKLPPLERITSPTAVLRDENTEIIVSVDTVFLPLM